MMLGERKKVKMKQEIEDFKLETTSIWSFPERGNWASHSGSYRGNWSPYVPRNLIVRYTKERDWVLDPFLGSGTTAIEAALLHRNFVGIDINPKAVDCSIQNMKNIQSDCYKEIRLGNACDMSFLKNDSIDLICMHPPYCNIIKYSDNIENDLSLLSLDKFYEKMQDVAKESFRVLKNEKYLGLLIADMRVSGNIIPLGFGVMQIFIDSGFELKEIVIKEQHNCRSTTKWESISKKRNFLLIKHEYLFILKKIEVA